MINLTMLLGAFYLFIELTMLLRAFYLFIELLVAKENVLYVSFTPFDA